MSRPVLGAVVAGIIAILTATAYFVTSGILRGGIERDVKLRVAKAQELLIQNSSLEMLGLLKRTEALARDPGLIKALVGGSGPNPVQAEQVFQKFRASLAAGEDQPDIMALTDENGKLVALVSAATIPTAGAMSVMASRHMLQVPRLSGTRCDPPALWLSGHPSSPVFCVRSGAIVT